jgi:hypothetical protein
MWQPIAAAGQMPWTSQPSTHVVEHHGVSRSIDAPLGSCAPESRCQKSSSYAPQFERRNAPSADQSMCVMNELCPLHRATHGGGAAPSPSKRSTPPAVS